MEWRFTLTDYLLTKTVVDEPLAWDTMGKSINRDREWHGVFFQFSESTLEFADEGYWIIKREYDRMGVDGDVALLIEWACDECDGFMIFYDGKLDFEQYDEVCGDYCSIKIGVNNATQESLISDRQDTDVDLTSNIAFDGTTVLADYDGLGNFITLPSKALHLKGQATTLPPSDDSPNSYNIQSDADFDATKNIVTGVIIPRLNNTVISEIDGFNPSFAFDYQGYTDNIASGLQDFQIVTAPVSGLGSGTNTFTISFRLKGSLEIKMMAPFPDNADMNTKLSVFLKYGNLFTDAFAPVLLVDYSKNLLAGTTDDHTVDFDYSASNIIINLQEGEKIYVGFLFENKTPYPVPQNVRFGGFIISLTEDSVFTVDQKSTTEGSVVKTFLLHEAVSRVIESITNNQFRLKSDYFGRTDSQPFAALADGCGGLRTLTNGLCIRNARLQDGTVPKVFTNFKNIFKSLNATDCVGIGLEPSPDFVGLGVIRIEPISFFYSGQIIFYCDGVKQIERKILTAREWNQFSFGYSKFETETTNGLDAIHTKRQYRTPTINSSQTLEKICEYITDGYAIEVTRRKEGTTEDWRYDQNIFMICLTRANGTLYNQFNADVVITNLNTISITVPIIIVSFDISPGDILLYNGVNYTIVTESFVAGILTLTVTPNFPSNGSFAFQLITIYKDFSTTSHIAVEQGNIADAANIFDPPTLLNYRISPIHMALKWFAWLMQGVKAPNQIIFNSGEGNYVAKGDLDNATCKLEAGVIAENGTITPASFFIADDALPFIKPETINFTFPLGAEEFTSILPVKYGLIAWRQQETDEWRYGWIDAIKYTPEDGTADFTLLSIGDGELAAITQSVVAWIGEEATAVCELVDGINDGIKCYTVLVEVNAFTRVPTGNTKPNDPLDPDYIPCVTDLVMCPIPFISWQGTDPVCLLDDALDNTGYALYNTRIRLINGVADGYSEANTEGTGIGVFIPPFYDILSCPTPCSLGFNPTLSSVMEDGFDIIITGTAVPLSTIQVLGSTTETGVFTAVGDLYTAEDLAAGIRLTPAQYGLNTWFRVHSYTDVCDFGYNLNATTGDDASVPTDFLNPRFFDVTDEVLTINKTAALVARFGNIPVFQLYVYDESGIPQLISGWNLAPDVQPPNTSRWDYLNSGSAGYILMQGTTDREGYVIGTGTGGGTGGSGSGGGIGSGDGGSGASSTSFKTMSWTIEGVQRTAVVWQPDGLTNLPILFAWHGHGGTGTGFSRKHFENYFDLDSIIVVYPNGLLTPSPADSTGTKTGWQHSVGEVDLHTGIVDKDLKFYDAMLLTFGASIDPSKILNHGWSNGGEFCYDCVWVARSTTVHALCCSSAILNTTSGKTPVPVMHTAGLTDPAVPFASQQSKFDDIKILNGCSGGSPWASGPNGVVATAYTCSDESIFLQYDNGHAYPDNVPALIVQFFQLVI